MGAWVSTTIDAVDVNGHTALHRAARDGDVKDVERLLAAGADVEARTAHFHNMTALHLASHKGHLEIVQALLEHGAEIEARDKDGYVPFFLCCTGLSDALSRRTALHSAAAMERTDVVEFLLYKGASAIIGDRTR